jgi:hypothetical protein
MSDQREQDSNPGGWRKGRFIMLAGQHPGSLQKWQLNTVGLLCLIILAQGYNLSHYLNVTVYHNNASVKLGPS